MESGMRNDYSLFFIPFLIPSFSFPIPRLSGTA